MSYRKIVKQVMQGIYSVSLATIHRIQHGMAEARFEKTFAKLAKLEYEAVKKDPQYDQICESANTEGSGIIFRHCKMNYI